MKDTAVPIEALYPEMELDYQRDYEAVRVLLATPARVAVAIGTLESAIQAVRADDHRLARHYMDEAGRSVPFDQLEVALLDMEARFGFTDVVVIPSGGDPFHDPNYGSNRFTIEAWTALVQAGHPVRDFGASRPHGECTHRIQWYVICAAFQNGTLPLTRTGPDAVLELYRAATAPEHRRRYERSSDGAAYTKTVWSDLFDYGLTKVIDARSTLWIQREILFCDWKNYFPTVSDALRRRFIARGGSPDPWVGENRQFFDGSAIPERHRSSDIDASSCSIDLKSRVRRADR